MCVIKLYSALARLAWNENLELKGRGRHGTPRAAPSFFTARLQ
jgi:hypothetical protein